MHGGVRDVQQYMVAPGIIRDNAALLREDFPGARLCFFGHSHEQKVYAVNGATKCAKSRRTLSCSSTGTRSLS